MTPQIRILTLTQWANSTAWRAKLQHSCDSHALIWITRGQGLGTVLGKRRGIGIHNVLIIPAGTLFSLELGRAGFGHVCLIPPGGPVLLPDEPLHIRLREVQAQAGLNVIFETLLREQNEQRPYTDEAMNAHAELMTIWLRRTLLDMDEPEARMTAAERLIIAYASLVERDYQTGNAMAAYARALGVTPTHLTRCCRQIAGLTAAELLTQRTLYAALEMLEETRDPVRLIASLLGFNSATYFSRFILHHTGQSPSALRKPASAKLL